MVVLLLQFFFIIINYILKRLTAHRRQWVE